MRGASLQADQLLNCLVGLSGGTGLQVLTKEDQSHDQGSCIVEGDTTNNLREEGCHYAQDIGCGRANRYQCIHIGTNMAQVFDCPTMKLPTHYCPDGSGERQQEIVLAREAVHEEHIEDDHGQGEYYSQYQQVALTGNFRLPP